jgi:hypothetical protein
MAQEQGPRGEQDWKPQPGDGAGGGSGLGSMLGEAKAAWSGPGGKLVAIVPAVVALVLGLVIGESVGGGGGTTDVAGPTVTITETAPAAGGGNGGGAPSAASTATGGVSTAPLANASSVGTVTMANLAAASGAFTSGDTSPQLNGKLQQESLVQDIGISGPSCGPSSGDAAYNLGRDYTLFTAEIGIDDNSPSSTLHPTVEIDGDGLKLASFTPTLGHPATASVNVSGVLRLDIIWSDPAASACTRGTSGFLVIGDPQLTTVPGYHPSPTATPAG